MKEKEAWFQIYLAVIAGAWANSANEEEYRPDCSAEGLAEAADNLLAQAKKRGVFAVKPRSSKPLR